MDLEIFLNVQWSRSPCFSHDDQHVIFRCNMTGVSQAWSISTAGIGGWPTQLTFANDSIRMIDFHETLGVAVFLRDAGGNENSQLYSIKFDDKDRNVFQEKRLSHFDKCVHSFGGFRKADGLFCFSSNRIDSTRFDLYVQDIDSKESTLLCEGPGGYFVPLQWSQSGEWILITRVESNFNQDLFVCSPTTKELKCITSCLKNGNDAIFRSAVWGEGNEVYCVSTANKETDLLGVAKINIDSESMEYVVLSEYEIECVYYKNGILLWKVNQDGASRLYFKQGGKDQQEIHLPSEGVVGGLSFANHASLIAFDFESPTANADIYLCDLNNPNKLQKLTHSCRAGLNFDSFASPKLVKYDSFDGLSIPAWFYPPRNGSSPIIVYPHGGPEAQTRPVFSALFQYFLQDGFGIFAPNVRGSSGYGVGYMNADNIEKRMDSVKDLAYGAKFLLKTEPDRKLVVYGGSYGGFMTLAQITHPEFSSMWSGAVSVVGICNFVTFLEKTGPYRRAHREMEYGNLREHRAFLESISPINHVSNIKCPLMVIHGANDPRRFSKVFYNYKMCLKFPPSSSSTFFTYL